MKAITDTLRQLSPLAYTANYDNVAITKSGRDFSEIDTKSLHEFLEHKYGSVEKLNNSWGTVYSSFSDAEPITIDEAKQSGAFTRWADTRFYQINRYAQIHSFVHDSIAAADSTVRVGIKDFQTVRNAYNGYDIPTLFKDFDVVISAYDAGTVMNGDFAITCALSSFMGTSVLRGLMVKGDKQSLSDETFLRTAPWQSLFLGMNSIWWDKFSGGAGSALSPDLSISPSFSVVAEESQEIMNGIDKLLLGAAIHRDGIGILYSPGSIIAAQILPEHGLNMVSSPDKNVLPESSNNVLKSARSFFLACKDLGYTPEFITENQVHENSLIDDGFSVLFLPYSRIISESALKRMKEFTNRGGTVIADVRPAVMGEDLSMRTSGALDEIFGISRETERTAHQGTGALKIIDTIDEDADTSDVTIPDFRGDSAVSVGDGAYARGRIGDYPVLIENSYEKGRGIFLNFGMEVYEKIRHNENERRIFLDVISRYIEAGGIDVPLVRIKEQGGNPEISANSSVFDDGAGKYIGIFMKPGSFLERTQLPKKYMMNIDFTENIYYVYNVRNGMFLGALSDIPIEFSPGRPELFALLPYRVKKLSLEIDKSVIRPGEKIAYNVTIEPQEKNTVPGRHIIRVGLLDPDGKEMQNFTDSYETFQGNFESSFQISRENPPGRWILTVQDIATGKKSERAFMIMSDKKGY